MKGCSERIEQPFSIVHWSSNNILTPAALASPKYDELQSYLGEGCKTKFIAAHFCAVTGIFVLLTFITLEGETDFHPTFGEISVFSIRTRLGEEYKLPQPLEIKLMKKSLEDIMMFKELEMGRTTSRVSISVSLLILAVLACQPGPATAPTFIVTIQPVPTVTLPFQMRVPEVASPTLVQVVLESTPTPTFTPTDTLIPSPTVPLVSVSVATNCRAGPGRVYERISVATIGMKYEVVAKNSVKNYWIIRGPDGRQCWLWGNYALVEGNITALPEFAPPVGSIRGKIVNAYGGMPIFSALVRVEPAGIFTYTNDRGEYRVDSVPIGEITISVDKPDYQSASLSMRLSDGQTLEGVNIAVFPNIPTVLPP